MTAKKDEKEGLVPVFVPPLVAILLKAENDKGSSLTEEEVYNIRNKANVIMLPIAAALSMAEKRGYADIDPELAWEQWQEVRADLHE